MHARILMIFSAVLLAILGFATSFMPREILGLHGTEPDAATILFVQMAGALYLGFAILNWSARGVIIGGSYARPLALGNFLHFTLVAITLIKAAIVFKVHQLAISAAVFSVFAIWFGLVLFRPPSSMSRD